MKEITTGKLLYNTERSARSSVMTYRGEMGEGGWNGREVQEKGMYVYLWLIHVVWQKATQHCKAKNKKKRTYSKKKIPYMNAYIWDLGKMLLMNLSATQE